MRAVLTLVLAACAADPKAVSIDPGEGSDGGNGSPGSSAVPVVRCAGAPDAGPATGFDHYTSSITAAVGSQRHRGIDLIATADADPQLITGIAAYGTVDKAIEDELVDVFACREQQWVKLGSVRTDSEGTFTVTLNGGSRLPIGVRDMFVSVQGDRTGAYFVTVIAPAGTALAISDVDGTLTSSENAFTDSLVTGSTVAIQPGAQQAFGDLAAKNYIPVYLTARPSMYTTETRAWLDTNQMPHGPVHLAPSIMLPGSGTAQFKADAMAAWRGFALAVGNGNRSTDVDAYMQAGLAPDRIFMKLPEYQSELQAQLDAHDAIGFTAYDDLRTQYIAQLPAM